MAVSARIRDVNGGLDHCELLARPRYRSRPSPRSVARAARTRTSARVASLGQGRGLEQRLACGGIAGALLGDASAGPGGRRARHRAGLVPSRGRARSRTRTTPRSAPGARARDRRPRWPSAARRAGLRRAPSAGPARRPCDFGSSSACFSRTRRGPLVETPTSGAAELGVEGASHERVGEAHRRRRLVRRPRADRRRRTRRALPSRRRRRRRSSRRPCPRRTPCRGPLRPGAPSYGRSPSARTRLHTTSSKLGGTAVAAYAPDSCTSSPSTTSCPDSSRWRTSCTA